MCFVSFCCLFCFVWFMACHFGGEQIASRINYQRIVSVYWLIYLVFICSSLVVLHLPGLFLCTTGANLFLASPDSAERASGQTFVFVQRRAASIVRAITASKKMSPVRHRDEWQSPKTAPGCRLICHIASPSDVRQLRVHRSIDSIGPPLLGDVGGNEWSAVHC